MKTSLVASSETEAQITITADINDLSPIKAHVLGHFKSSVKVSGFRPGKAPLDLIEKNANQNSLTNEFLEHAINELYRRAVNQENIRPLGQPDVQVTKFVPYSLLEFKVKIQTIGPIKLANYKAIKLARSPVKITAKEVDGITDQLRQRGAERIETERPAKDGDEVLIDFKGIDDGGQPVAGAEGKDYPLQLGSGSFIPGFEDNLLGLKKSDKKSFDLTFPKDYNVPGLRGQKVQFDVTVLKVNKLKIPVLDDSFAAKLGPFKTIAELKTDVKKQLLNDKNQQASRDYENQLIKKITDGSTVIVPPILVDEQVTQMEESEKRDLAARGITWQEHLAQEAVSEDQHRQRQKPAAEERVKASLVLSEIAEKENIEVTPEELEIRIQLLKGQYKDEAMQKELDKPENRQDIANRLLTEKTIQKLAEYGSK